MMFLYKLFLILKKLIDGGFYLYYFFRNTELLINKYMNIDVDNHVYIFILIFTYN